MVQPPSIEIGVGTDVDAVLQRYEEENRALKEKCDEYESCVELLKNEYEKCEDYWQNKLDEERQIFEQEQTQSGEKLNELIGKMAEYEEQFADNRLPTIDETYNLEQQFTDLEQEYENYKIYSENELFKRDEEISILRQKLSEISCKDLNEVGVQVSSDETLKTRMSHLSYCIGETTNFFSAEPQKNNENFVWNQEPTTSNTSTLEKPNAPCRPKRTRKHERNNSLYRKNPELKKPDEALVTVPLNTMHCLNSRLHHLEQRCRQLLMALKQQPFFMEQAIQQCRQQNRSEKIELQCIIRNQQEKLEQQMRVCNEQLDRLARADVLVKDLYVENAYLVAEVQRLQQQCHVLVEYNHSTSV